MRRRIDSAGSRRANTRCDRGCADLATGGGAHVRANVPADSGAHC